MSTFTLIFDPGIEPSETGAVITATTYPGYSDPTNYNVLINEISDSGYTQVQNFDVPSNPPTSSKLITVTGLKSGTSYQLVLVPSLNGLVPDSRFTWRKEFSTTSSYGGQTVSSTRQDFKVSKSYLQLAVTAAQYKNKQSAVFYRNFDSLTIPTTKTVSTTNGNSYDTGYFSFGTSLIMKDTLENTLHAGGVGFFLNESATSGYYIIMESTSSASATLDKKSVRIEKWIGSSKIPLKEVGTRTESTIEGIFGGRTYNVDVKVKVDNQSVTITAFINGYGITVTDTTYKINNKIDKFKSVILAPSKKMGLVCTRGEVAFDYGYANTLNSEQYKDRISELNIYQGQFNNDLINTSYGDLIYMAQYDKDEIPSDNKKSTAVDEFGTVVREIITRDVSFNKRPAYPTMWSTGINPFAKILGSKISNFGSKIFVMNNTSQTIPLSNGAEASFLLLGNSLGNSGELEYSTDELNDYVNKEPAVFISSWLQNESDVKSLANWIKSNVVNKGKIINMTIFGNPLISVGDIVSIKNVYQGLAGTESFIVTEVKHSFSEGLETSITCRTL
jgi:hypothetical protein